MNEKIPCWECSDGFYLVEKRPYETTDGKGSKMIIEDVPHLVCQHCDDIVFDTTASRMIEEARIKAGVKYRTRKR